MSVKNTGVAPLIALAPAALLFVGRSFNMQSTADQAFTRNFAGTNYYITSVVARQRTGAGSATNTGGIYTGAGKTGDQLVASSQQWVSLASGVIVTATIAAVSLTALESATPFLSLTIGSAAPLTADIFIYGFDIT